MVFRIDKEHSCWGGAQRNPRYDRGVSSQPAKRATAIGPISLMMKWRMTKSCRPLRGLDAYLRHIPGVPLTLHPRLYSAARIRGLRTRQNVGKDKRVEPEVEPQEYGVSSRACIQHTRFVQKFG